MSYKVMSTPALVIDSRVKIVDKLPRKEELHSYLNRLNRDGLNESDYDDNIVRYLPEAENVENMIIDQCHDNNDNYFNLQIGGEAKNFQNSFKRINDKGVITVFRSEPPISGTTCTVKFPEKRF